MALALALAGLGKMLGASRLARAGADLAKKAIDRVPRMTEKIFGEQEAALREVLRQLQSGDVEQGLRRAPIAVGDPSQSGGIDTGSRLGTRDPRYSLRDLLSSGSGTAGWLGGGDVWHALAAEYRRLANEAVQRGDFRRAAYLHGVLLRDVRTAANILASGGLSRDAALLYRDKVNDLLAAALAFDRAGDHDEAIRLYLKQNKEEEAADVLSRLGEDERALKHYLRAAESHATQGRSLAAGDLMGTKAGNRPLAIRFYRLGWDRATAEQVNCGQKLLDEMVQAESWTEADSLIDEAVQRLEVADAGRFFNQALTRGHGVLSPERRDDWSDRARLLFARHLRAGSGKVEELFHHSETWSGALVRDATVAVRQERRSVPPVLTLSAPIRLANGSVVAAVAARDRRGLVVATTESIVCWRSDTGNILTIESTRRREILGLSTDREAKVVYILFALDQRAYLVCFEAVEPHRFEGRGRFDLPGELGDRADYYLQPHAVHHYGELQVTVCVGSQRTTLAGVNLKPTVSTFSDHAVQTHALIASGSDIWDWHQDVLCRRMSAIEWLGHVVHWQPAIPIISALRGSNVDWLSHIAKVLEVVATDRKGAVHWVKFDGRDRANLVTQEASHPQRFLAACLEGPGLVVAATADNEIHWLRVNGSTLTPSHPMRKLTLTARVVFMATRPHQRDILALLEDGSAARIIR